VAPPLADGQDIHKGEPRSLDAAPGEGVGAALRLH
jgi:hypothetical protein